MIFILGIIVGVLIGILLQCVIAIISDTTHGE